MARVLIQKLATAAVCALFGTLLSGCMTYDIAMTYTCVILMNTTAGLTCGEWMQQGGVKTPSCFPRDATVMTRSGPKAMADLNKGEEILGLDHATGQKVFTAVRAWLHRDPHPEVMMTAVESDAGSLVASNRHLLAVQGGEAYEFAGDLRAGKDALVAQDGSSATVRKVSDVRARGLYAPLTRTSNFFVGGKGETPGVLAHSFAQVQRPRRYEAIFHRFLDVVELFWHSVNDVDASNDAAYVHPVARAWMWIAGVPTTDAMTIRRTIQTPNGEAGFAMIDKPEDASEKKPDCEKDAEVRRLAEGRRLYGNGGNGGGGGEGNNQLMVILFGVVQQMPPFLRHGIIPAGTPGFSPGWQGTGDAEQGVKDWLAGAMKTNTYMLIASTALFCCGFCCFCALNILGAASGGPKE